MRIRILSDLHREFGTVIVPEVAADVVVLAGDIDRGARGVAWARLRFPETPVLYIAGNHEFYGERIGRLHEKLRDAAAGSNVVILENESFSMDGYRFFGATLWTDFALCADRQVAMITAGDNLTGMNDYRKIRREDAGRLQPKHTALLHADTRLALTEFLAQGERFRSIVITHHAPSQRSLPDDRRGQPISAAYASDLEPLIKECGPVLWIHGHIHTARDYPVGQTRVINNAHGYPESHGPESTGFRGDLVVEV